MGYFPNGTTQEQWEAEYCRDCLHYELAGDDGCPVMTAHFVGNYAQLREGETASLLAAVLSFLIPRETLHNGPCAMRLEAAHV